MDSERTCELLITGKLDSVDAARVRLLAMLDKLSGLHADSVEIDCKLLCIVAKRKRAAIQEIQEETATNIYYPSPLHGLTGKSVTSLRSILNVVWITGDFLNVQRAKDKLLKASLAVVRVTHKSTTPVTNSNFRATASCLAMSSCCPGRLIGCCKIDQTTSKLSCRTMVHSLLFPNLALKCRR